MSASDDLLWRHRRNHARFEEDHAPDWPAGVHALSHEGLLLLGLDANGQLHWDGKPVEVTSIVLSTQHSDKKQKSKDIRAIVEPYILEVLPEGWITKNTEWHVNPTGTFVIGGPDGTLKDLPWRTSRRTALASALGGGVHNVA